MNDQPKIAVAGHLVSDEIVYADGKKTSAPGGISYNLASLLSVMDGGKILPVCEIGSDFEDIFDRHFGRHGIIDKSSVKVTSLPNVVNRLVYESDGTREEWNSRIPNRLSLGGIRDDVDAVLLNFISGDDFSIEELSEFKTRYHGLSFCDFHSLALGRDNDGKRYFRKNPEWERYLTPVDMVQMNVRELSTISGVEELSFGNIIAVCSLIHGLGPEICVITLGRNGAMISLDRGKSAYHIPPISISDEIDPTGCGDTFAAVFLYKFLSSNDPLQSAAIANRYAAAKVTFAGLDGFDRLDTVLNEIGPGTDPVKIK